MSDSDSPAGRRVLGALADAVGPQPRLLLDTIVLGIVGALGARGFVLLLEWARRLFLVWGAGYHEPGLPGEGGVLQQVVGPHGLWLIPLATTAGGLLSGLLVYTYAPEAEGHGTDTVVKAYHRAGGFIRARVAPIKTVASALTIGSGGSAGREGPTALIAAGIGSLYATLTKQSTEDRRLLSVVGMAAGLSAVFRSPIGTALFAIEVLYGDVEFEASALLYALLAAIVAYALNGAFVGWEPLFQMPANMSPPDLPAYLWYAVLGVMAGVVATLVPVVFYRTRDLFHRLPVPNVLKPAIGGLVLGVLALAVPQVLGGGYGWIQEAINGQLALGLLVTLVFAKLAAFALTVGSGGSGGVFAPTLFVGAMLGGSVAHLVGQPPAGFAVVGMAATFGGAARVPIATLLMVTEMTEGYTFLVPAGLAVTLSYLVQSVLSSPLKYRSLYEAQVPGRADSPVHHVDHLESVIHLLGMKQTPFPSTVSHLSLRALLAAGVPVDLPGGKQVFLGVLKRGSPLAGKTLAACEAVAEGQIETVAVFREGQTLLAHGGVTLRRDDQVVAVVTPDARLRLAAHFAAPRPLRSSPAGADEPSRG